MRSRRVDNLNVKVFQTREEMGLASAEFVAGKMKKYMKDKEIINLMFAAAPSQDEFLKHLIARDDLDWSRVRAFHLDEYIGLPEEAAQRFGNYLDRNIFKKVKMNDVFYLDNQRLNSLEAKVQNYVDLLEKYSIEIACIGIGENGHIAFNDPHVADFNDPVKIKTVELDEHCRQQQVNDGCFERIEDVPDRAVTVTIPAIMEARTIACMVPGPYKREAVKHTLEDAIETIYPATVLRKHDDATLFLDEKAAELLK